MQCDLVALSLALKGGIHRHAIDDATLPHCVPCAITARHQVAFCAWQVMLHIMAATTVRLWCLLWSTLVASVAGLGTLEDRTWSMAITQASSAAPTLTYTPGLPFSTRRAKRMSGSDQVRLPLRQIDMEGMHC